MATIEIHDKLYKEIQDFCNINNLLDVDGFCVKLITLGFNIEKYGVSPFTKKHAILDEKLVASNEQKSSNEEIETVKPNKKVRIIKR